MIGWEEYRETKEEGDTSWSEFNSCQIIADVIAVEIKNLEVTAQDFNVSESAIDDLEEAFECMKRFYAKMQNGKENHWNAYKNLLEQNMEDKADFNKDFDFDDSYFEFGTYNL